MKRLPPVLAIIAGMLLLAAPASAHQSPCAKETDHPNRCARVLVLGHRAHKGLNENTLLALQRDAKAGVGDETDAWATRDGHIVIFHDEYPCRTIDETTLPYGTSCRTPIYDFTIGQVRQLRTKADNPQPVPTLKQWVKEAARLHVRTVVERKKRPGAPELEAAKTTAIVKDAGALNLVSFYEVPKCMHGHVLHSDFNDFGLTVGAKYLGGCQPTPEEMAEADYTFVITSAEAITRTYVNAVHQVGMTVGNYDSGKQEVWAHLATVGADIAIAPKPVLADHYFH